MVSLRTADKLEFVYDRTRQEASEKLRQLQHEVARQGILADPGKRTVNDLLHTWLETAGPTLKPRTLQTYRQLCDTYVRPVMGRLKLSRLTPDVVQRLLVLLQKQGKT